MGGLRRFRPALTLPALAITGVLLLGGTAQAGTVEIHDAMHVLSQTETSSVTNAASQLPDPVKIYTTNILANDTSAFDARIQTHITAPNDIVIGINTQSHHIAVRGGPRAGLSSSADLTAITAFKAAYQGSQSYSAGLLGMLAVLQSSIHGPGVIQHQGVLVHHKSTSMVLVIGAVIAAVIGLIVIVAIVRGIGRLLGFGRRQGPPVYQQPGYGPRPGYGPGPGPGYGPGYGGGYGGGMSPGAAAGLGAVGGGLLGYELGRMEGEERREEYYDQGGYNQGGYDQGGYNQGGYDQGGGSAADGDFGGGGGDWGGGGGDSF